MRHFITVGDKKLNIVEAATHARSEAKRIVREIEALKPDLLLVDRSKTEWQHVGNLDGFQQVLYDTVAGGGYEPDVVWKGVKRTAHDHRIRVGLLFQDHVPPPPGKDGLKGLQRALLREGFERTGEPLRDVTNFDRHFVQRFPALWKWRAEHIDHCARVLARGISDQPTRVMVVMTAPGVEALIDQVGQHRA